MPGLSEFDLIRHLLTGLGAKRADVVLGVGDDAAITNPAVDNQLVMALDTVVADVHFPGDWPAEWVGHRALAVNLSDMAAMGARPQWALLGLTLPAMDADWVAGFARGLDALAKAHDVAVIGGDVTRGPLAVTVQITGAVSGCALRRDGAQIGDQVWVSGRPGEAAAGLAVWQSHQYQTEARWGGLSAAFSHPTPRIALGQALSSLASAAIDVSDGLAADLGHIAAASGVAIVLNPDCCRASARLRAWAGAEHSHALMLGGGDDYELAFCAPAAAAPAVAKQAQATRTPVRCIGQVTPGSGVLFGRQRLDSAQASGYQHFTD